MYYVFWQQIKVRNLYTLAINMLLNQKYNNKKPCNNPRREYVRNSFKQKLDVSIQLPFNTFEIPNLILGRSMTCPRIPHPIIEISTHLIFLLIFFS